MRIDLCLLQRNYCIGNAVRYTCEAQCVDVGCEAGPIMTSSPSVCTVVIVASKCLLRILVSVFPFVRREGVFVPFRQVSNGIYASRDCSSLQGKRLIATSVLSRRICRLANLGFAQSPTFLSLCVTDTSDPPEPRIRLGKQSLCLLPHPIYTNPKKSYNPTGRISRLGGIRQCPTSKSAVRRPSKFISSDPSLQNEIHPIGLSSLDPILPK